MHLERLNFCREVRWQTKKKKKGKNVVVLEVEGDNAMEENKAVKEDKVRRKTIKKSVIILTKVI